MKLIKLMFEKIPKEIKFVIFCLLFYILFLAYKYLINVPSSIMLDYSKSTLSTSNTILFINPLCVYRIIYYICAVLSSILIPVAILIFIVNKSIPKNITILTLTIVIVGVGGLFGEKYSYINITNDGIHIKSPLLKEDFYDFKDISNVNSKCIETVAGSRSRKEYHYSYEYLIKLPNGKTIDLAKNMSNADIPNLDKIHRILIDEYNISYHTPSGPVYLQTLLSLRLNYEEKNAFADIFSSYKSEGFKKYLQ